ncbi:hypothetical protein [Culicoidibacter larvae]|uniref:Uncharacterized protein n=1 Tax=Culicoidibacter larvae TaxID=2579976 RepID=A0A5R8Q739_9FIRM|nr:hypothetical protein [Culicoidibacter larvae]TLG71229.1 hypothetical protein FEZ08_11280 [Culicoidibacter larvae]
MRIGIIHGSSQIDKNQIMAEQLALALQQVEDDFEILNFGIFADETTELTTFYKLSNPMNHVNCD